MRKPTMLVSEQVRHEPSCPDSSGGRALVFGYGDPGPRGYKTFFMLSSAEHEISTAHKC